VVKKKRVKKKSAVRKENEPEVEHKGPRVRSTPNASKKINRRRKCHKKVQKLLLWGGGGTAVGSQSKRW